MRRKDENTGKRQKKSDKKHHTFEKYGKYTTRHTRVNKNITIQDNEKNKNEDEDHFKRIK